MRIGIVDKLRGSRRRSSQVPQENGSSGFSYLEDLSAAVRERERLISHWDVGFQDKVKETEDTQLLEQMSIVIQDVFATLLDISQKYNQLFEAEQSNQASARFLGIRSQYTEQDALTLASSRFEIVRRAAQEIVSTFFPVVEKFLSPEVVAQNPDFLKLRAFAQDIDGGNIPALQDSWIDNNQVEAWALVQKFTRMLKTLMAAVEKQHRTVTEEKERQKVQHDFTQALGLSSVEMLNPLQQKAREGMLHETDKFLDIYRSLDNAWSLQLNKPVNIAKKQALELEDLEAIHAEILLLLKVTIEVSKLEEVVLEALTVLAEEMDTVLLSQRESDRKKEAQDCVAALRSLITQSLAQPLTSLMDTTDRAVAELEKLSRIGLSGGLSRIPAVLRYQRKIDRCKQSLGVFKAESQRMDKTARSQKLPFGQTFYRYARKFSRAFTALEKDYKVALPDKKRLSSDELLAVLFSVLTSRKEHVS